jgi:tetratricopeptide (TPR) repeat protein
MEKRLPLPTSRLFAFSLASTFFCTLSIFGLILLATGGLAQSAEDMPLRQVISSAQSKIGEGDFAGAAPYLDELEVRFEDEEDPEIAKILQQFGFVRGVGYLQSFAKTGDQGFLGKAAAAFGFFAEKFPNDPKAVMAMQKRTMCLRALHEFKEAAKVIEILLDPQKPYRKQILKRSELMNLYFGRAQCYHIEQAWVQGEPAFRELLLVADKAKDEDRAAYAVSCLVEMFVVNKRIDDVFPLLPRLTGDTPARYDIRLNVNLMTGAEQLKTAGRHLEASLFFALTMTTEEIKNYYEERLKQLKAELTTLKNFMSLRGRALPRRRAEILKDRINELAMKVTNAQGRLDQIAKIPSFTTTLRWRKAENYKETKRDWEAFWAFYWLYKDFPKHDNVENFLYAAFASANGVKHREKSIELGEEYLANTDWKSFRADVTFIMANAYQSEAKAQDALAKSFDGAISTKDREAGSVAKTKAEEYYNRFFELCDRFLEVMPEHEYSRDFINMMGSVYFGRKRFDDLLVKFAGVENGVMDKSKGYVNNEKFNKSPAMAPAHYFSGLALLATGKFNEAKPLLGALVGVNVTGLPVKDLSDIDGLGGEEEFKEKPYVPETDSNQSEGL